MQVSMNKKYRTRQGDPVRILCIDRDYPDYPVVGLIKNEHVVCWDSDGEFISGGVSGYDLVEETPYADFKIDDRVFVRDHIGNKWLCRHFAGVSEFGTPLTFPLGSTSWSHDPIDEKTEWQYCVKTLN